MKLTVLIGIVLAAQTCGGGPKPPNPSPGPTPLQSNVSIYDEAGAPVTDATCTLSHDMAPSEPPQSETLTGWRLSFAYNAPPVHEGWGAELRCQSPSYVTTAKRYAPLPTGELEFPPMKSAHTWWGDEQGFLHRDGKTLKTEAGAVWRERGATDFQLVKQYCENPAIADTWVEDKAKYGAREFRVLLMFDPYIGSFTLARDDLPRLDRCLLDLTRDLAAHGLRIMVTILADAQNVMPETSKQQVFVNHIAHRDTGLLKDEWNVRFELCNECDKNGVDPSKIIKPPTRQPFSCGSGTSAADPKKCLGGVQGDTAEYHEARDDEYPRKNECRPYMDDGSSPFFGVPCFQSEPMGASEVNQPGRRAGAVNGDPTQAINDFRQMAANFALNSPGGVFHSDAGIVGGLLGPVQAQMAQAFFQGLNFPPTDAYLRTYKRGDNCGDCDGVGGMWLTQRDLPAPCGTLRTFQRDDGSHGHAVEIRRNGCSPQPRAGARILNIPGPGLIELAR